MKWTVKKAWVLSAVIILLSCTNTFSIDFSMVNISWRYDVNAPIRLQHRVVADGDQQTVFFHVKSDDISRWKWEFLVQTGYETEEDREITPSVDTLRSDSGDLLLRLDLAPMKENLLVIKITSFESFLFYDVPLQIGRFSFPSLYPLNQEGYPILKSYSNRAIISWTGDSSFLATEYPERFPPADPPMEEGSLLASANADTAFHVSDTTTLKDNYFYVVRKDSLATTAVTLLKMPPYFPEYRKLDELIESMLYITTSQERKALINSRSPKASFDSFWMNTFSTKSFARNAIRRYYNKVENANRLFTDFMPGWKTDRGMIYIIFGPPQEVYRTGNSEEWYYTDQVFFEFNIISSFFAPKTYTLRRSLELWDIWSNQVAAIRSGIE